MGVSEDGVPSAEQVLNLVDYTALYFDWENILKYSEADRLPTRRAIVRVTSTGNAKTKTGIFTHALVNSIMHLSLLDTFSTPTLLNFVDSTSDLEEKKWGLDIDGKPIEFSELLQHLGPPEPKAARAIAFGIASAFCDDMTPENGSTENESRSSCGSDVKYRCGTMAFIQYFTASNVTRALFVRLRRPRSNPPSEMWALGFLMYAMLSGELPWETEHRTLSSKIRYPHVKWDRISPDAKEAVRACLQSSPSSPITPSTFLKLPWMRAYQEDVDPTRFTFRLFPNNNKDMARAPSAIISNQIGGDADSFDLVNWLDVPSFGWTTLPEITAPLTPAICDRLRQIDDRLQQEREASQHVQMGLAGVFKIRALALGSPVAQSVPVRVNVHERIH